jgi:transposase
MDQYSEVFVGIDTSKLRNAVAIAEAGRNGEVRYLGEIDTSEAATRKLVAKLAAKYRKLTFCYEAGPTGYGLYRLIKSLGHDCTVVAPSLIPRKPGDHVKTNRRDGLTLAKLLRAGELTAVWVPDERHEAMRDLSRAREMAMVDLKRKRQQILSLLLRLGLYFPGKTTWGKAHRRWLADQKIAQREQRIVFEDALRAEAFARERVDGLAQAIRAAVPEWSLREVVTALQALRGIDLIAAVKIVTEIGDLSRFPDAAALMSYLGLVPSERSTGDRVQRGGITKTGSGRARRVLVEASWSYRHPPRIGLAKQAKVEAAPEPVRAIAWTAQMRLSARYRALNRKGKRPTVVVTAIARELAGFIWAIGRALGDASTRGGLPPDALQSAVVRGGPQGQAPTCRKMGAR